MQKLEDFNWYLLHSKCTLTSLSTFFHASCNQVACGLYLFVLSWMLDNRESKYHVTFRNNTKCSIAIMTMWCLTLDGLLQCPNPWYVRGKCDNEEEDLHWEHLFFRVSWYKRGVTLRRVVLCRLGCIHSETLCKFEYHKELSIPKRIDLNENPPPSIFHVSFLHWLAPAWLPHENCILGLALSTIICDIKCLIWKQRAAKFKGEHPYNEYVVYMSLYFQGHL